MTTWNLRPDWGVRPELTEADRQRSLALILLSAGLILTAQLTAFLVTTLPNRVAPAERANPTTSPKSNDPQIGFTPVSSAPNRRPTVLAQNSGRRSSSPRKRQAVWVDRCRERLSSIADA